MLTKPHLQIPIADNHEPLVPIPKDVFAFVSPHLYVKLGAPYGERSPFLLRANVLERLVHAQDLLQSQQPGWHIQIFDAYRPLPVQQFMVSYSFEEQLQLQGLQASDLSSAQEQAIWEHVHQFWAEPSLDPTTPPPHSTGAAVDVTFVNSQGQPVPMGSPIDELSPRSYLNYFADRSDSQAQQYHQSRLLLRQVMESAGFCNHPKEWWHFSYGDQLWAWRVNQAHPEQTPCIACYGRVD